MFAARKHVHKRALCLLTLLLNLLNYHSPLYLHIRSRNPTYLHIRSHGPIYLHMWCRNPLYP